jgi:2-phospho-L-lactate guanylyltransferase
MSLEALADAERVAKVRVVTSDPQAALMAAHFGAEVVPDPGLGLNAALAHGIASPTSSELPVALVMPDLPCLRASMLDQVLALAIGHRLSVVPDKNNTGTTMLLGAVGHLLQPQFGTGSYHRHVMDGAHPIALDFPAARLDVDTPEDLELARRSYGPGPRTRRILNQLGSARDQV